MIIAVDFDGVITPNGHWPSVGEPNAAVIEWLKELKENGKAFQNAGDKERLEHGS